jgi:Ca2+-binding EF-hand superfamily protein
MTRTTKLLVTAGALALGATAFASVGLADGGCGWHGGWGGHGGPGQGLFESFDTNHDGKVTQDEIDQAPQARFAKFDKNGDGKLSLEEYQALWLDAMNRQMVRAFQALDVNGDGAVTKEEFVARFEYVVQRLDTNGDGQLTQDELRQRFHDRMGQGMHGRAGDSDGGPGCDHN